MTLTSVYAFAEGIPTEYTIEFDVKDYIVSIDEITDSKDIKLGEQHTLPDKVSATLASGGKIELEIAWKWKTATQVGNVSVTGTIYAGEYEVDEGISLKTTKKVNVAASGDKSSGSEKGCKSSAEGASALFALPILFTAAYICKNLRRKIR